MFVVYAMTRGGKGDDDKCCQSQDSNSEVSVSINVPIVLVIPHDEDLHDEKFQ